MRRSEVNKMEKKEVLRLIRNINKSKRRIQKGLYPLEFHDQGWRIILPKALENYTFLPSGRKLLRVAKYSIDFEGGYYYIQFSKRP